MGFLSAYSGTKKITVGTDPDGPYWVEIKTCLTSGDKEKADQALASGKLIPGQKPEMAMNIVKYRQLTVQASIVDWNLDDDNGKIWPIDLAHVRKLPAPVFDQIYKEVDEANKPATTEETKSFRPEGVSGDPDEDGGSADTGDVPA